MGLLGLRKEGETILALNGIISCHDRNYCGWELVEVRQQFGQRDRRSRPDQSVENRPLSAHSIRFGLQR